MSDNSLQSILERLEQPVVQSEKLKILIYGPSGVGKTSLYAGAKNALILDVEEGTSSINNEVKAEMIKNGSRFFPLKSWEDLQGIFTLIQEGKIKFNTIIMDSVTDIQELCKEHILTTQSRNRVSPETPSQQDYGVLTERMRKMVRNFRSLDSNIVYIARERFDKDETTGEERVRPDIVGKLQNDLPGAVDIVGYMLSVEGERKIGFDLEGKWLAKDRTNRLPKVMDDPSWEKLEKIFPELVDLTNLEQAV